MRITGSVSRMAASLTVPVALAATGLLLGGGVATAATAARGLPEHPAATADVMASHVTWHKLSLLHGWVSGESTYGTGNPAWAVKGGVVYLSGSVIQRSGTNQVVAVLPPAARPTRVLWISVYTLDDSHGFVTIYPTGELYATATPQSNARGYTSLAGISYPAGGTKAHKLVLRNGWKSSQSQWNSGDPAYSLINGVVHLSGSLHRASGSNRLFAILPPGARSAHVLYLSVYTYRGSTGVLKIATNGDMSMYLGRATAYTSLASITFPVHVTGSHQLALIDGWKSSQSEYNSGNPSYSVSGGIVYLSGSLHQVSGSDDAFATLPAAARPAHELYISTYTLDGAVGTVFISPAGTMEVYAPDYTDAQDYSSLASISYPLGS